MQTATNHLGLRIIITTLLVGLFILALATYRTYSGEMKKEISEKITEYFPDLDSSLAQL